MSVRKCSACGNTTKGEVPFCSTCGALFPVGDEAELMRQAVGYSFDWKWVLLGTLTAVVLQLGLVLVLWTVWGNKFVVGDRGRSLLQVNLDNVSPGWGPNTGGTRVALGIKPDNKGENTALSVVGVSFGGVRAEPFHVQHLGFAQKECARHCAHRLTAQRQHRDCMQGCDEAKLKAEESRLGKAREPCDELDAQRERNEFSEEKHRDAYAKANCPVILKEGEELKKLTSRCREECPKREKLVKLEEGRCTGCEKQLEILKKRAEDCQKDVTKCWSFADDMGKVAMPKESDFKSAQEYQRARKEAAALDRRRRTQEQQQLKNTVHVYAPKAPSVEGLVDVKLVFRSGEELVKREGFAFAVPGAKERPSFKSTPHKLHDPVQTIGFWMMLLVSALFYLLGGFVLGRLSPGIGIKEPFTSGFLAFMLFQVVLALLGTSGTAQLFTVFIGAPLFIASTVLGAYLADRSLGYG